MHRLRVLEGRAANAIGRIGERYQIDSLIYSPLRMHQFHLIARDNAPPFAEALRTTFPFVRFCVDVGCGSGAFAAALNASGLVTIGLERNRVGRAIACMQGVDARPFDLTAESPAKVPGGFDLAYCIEVAEHLPAELGDRLVSYVADLAPVVVFTAAQPGQGGTGHVNEQAREYWYERFELRGLTADAGAAKLLTSHIRSDTSHAPWLCDNLAVFRRELA